MLMNAFSGKVIKFEWTLKIPFWDKVLGLALFNDTLRSKISHVDEKLLEFYT